jgi:class 3 adenylate cyclase
MVSFSDSSATRLRNARSFWSLPISSKVWCFDPFRWGSHMERRLAAILAADVVGYSALMEVDEAGTFERLKARRTDLFEPEIARHHGRIFKLLGDGVLAEFFSVVNAVECAVALQRAFAERNA